ncbi:hypothetical protein N2W54_005311 [Lotmaria passim]
MLSEREVITVAFGNYSSLVAAQWANGTSHFDVHHHTLYEECRNADVLGCGGGGSGSSPSQRTRVPRLLLLDAPYSATFDDVTAWVDKYDADSASHAHVEAEEAQERGSGAGKASASGHPRYVDTGSAASVLWGGKGADPRSSRLTAGEDKAARRLDSVAKAVQQHVWAQHGFDEDEEDEESSEEEDDYTRLRCELGIAPYTLNAKDSDDISNTSSRVVKRRLDREDEREKEEEAASAGTEQHDHQCHGHSNNMARQKPLTNKKRVAQLKKRLFDMRNTTIPWWQYITTGLAAHSVTSVRPLQHVDAAGDIPALHSFGHGVAHLHADKNNEVAALCDALRMQLEAADQLQGVQCFIDGDSMFGGAAANVLEQFWDEAGAKTPVVQTCLFTPLPSVITDPQCSGDVSFRERRLDETALNQLLATLFLSRHPSAVYIPIPLAQWGEFFCGTATAASPAQSPAWLQDERATAQYVAAVLDTALYGVRDGNNTAAPPSRRGANDRDNNATLRTQGPMYYLDDWCRVVRPAPSLRVAAAMGALPQPVSQSSEFWQFLQSNPLLPDAPVVDERMPASGKADGADDSMALKTGFMPLTHAMSASSPLSSGGRVLGHAVCLRGAGVLPSTVYSTREALLRYALPLGTSTYLPLATESNYPISRTFPMELMFANPSAVEHQLPRGLSSLRDALSSVDVGAHVLSTYASAPMLREIVGKAQSALRHKTDSYCAAYEMEKDEWREAVDEGLALHDDYHHAAPSDAEEDSHGDGDY